MKRLAIAEASTSSLIKKSKIEKPSKLSDLNYDCLLEIFKDFSLDDLINIVNYDEGVGNAAQHIFTKKYGEKLMTITNEFNRHQTEPSWSMLLLKHFGCVITTLRMEYKSEFRRVDYLFDELIVASCCKSLTEIEFVNADSFTMKDISEPFEEMLMVTFVKSKFSDLISNFSKWFPKAHTLQLKEHICSTLDDRLMLEHHHPKLKQFSIQNSGTSGSVSERKLNNSNISTFIKLNPQLEKLSIFCDDHPTSDTVRSSVQSAYDSLYVFDGIKIDHELLGIIKSKLKNLRELKIRFGQNGLQIKLPAFHFNEINSLWIELKDSEMLNSFPIKSDKIKELHLNGGELRPSIVEFIQLHKSINILDLRGTWDSAVTVQGYRSYVYFVPEIIRLTTQLPFLNELHISYQTPSFEPGQMFTLLAQCPLLRKLVIYADDLEPAKQQEIINGFQALSSVPNGWKRQFSDDWDNFRRYRLTFTK